MRLIVFWLVCVAVYYLTARASITRVFWAPLDSVHYVGELLRCPACSGTYIGALVSLIWPLYPHEHAPWACAESLVTHALSGLVLTAVGWALLKISLAYGAVESESDDDEEAHTP